MIELIYLQDSDAYQHCLLINGEDLKKVTQPGMFITHSLVIIPEVRKWLDENTDWLCGELNLSSFTIGMEGRILTLMFNDKDDAMRFKLTWG
jgi:hypothetical protein